MNINAAIIDQRITALSREIESQAAEELGIRDETRLRSLAFLHLAVQLILDLDAETAFDCLTEGGRDFGIDAIHLSEELDGEFVISLFQAKYKRTLSGDAHYPESGIEKLEHAIRYIFDPHAVLDEINDRLRSRVEEARSLIRDGYIPFVRAFACNNGRKWTQAAEERIRRASSSFGDQVVWEHVNHDRLVLLLQKQIPIDAELQLTGKAIVEDMNYSRILLGRIAVGEIARLMQQHGERLLERNIRRYLGLLGNRVNEAIQKTLLDDPENFYFYNNGITLTCDKFTYNALQQGDYRIRLKNLQIINGGQTCMTIAETLNSKLPGFREGYVLLRLYELPPESEELARQITVATNSQNPVDLRDLRANDRRQRDLELDIEQLGFVYHRKRSTRSMKSNEFTSGTAAEAILSVWRRQPHQAKFFRREHFGKLYDRIFAPNLTGAQAITAVLLFRIAENHRRRPHADDPTFVRYASCFIAMQMGRYLLEDLGVRLEELDHTCFEKARRLVEEKGEVYFRKGREEVEKALMALYGGNRLSLQQLSATFRRGDLVSFLDA
ncbi:MAG: abortive phage resistance protein [Deltaproteobacteria bacterium]|nr:MAG: abortive phage resistance protein [Deltaproteobacteria bacterium]